MTENQDDKKLVEAAQTGDRDAFSQLVEKHYGLVYSLAWSNLRNEEAARDLSQEVFLRAWMNIRKLRDSARFVSWIAQLARNLGRDWNRKGESFSKVKQMIEVESQEAERRGRQPEVLEKMAEQDRMNSIQQVLDAVTDEQRELLLLHYDQGLSHRRIAEHLGIHHTTVGRQIEKALETARSVLSGDSASVPGILKLRKPPQGVHETMALIGVTMALPLASQASVMKVLSTTAPAAITSSSSSTTTSSGFLASLLQIFTTGGATMGTVKLLTASAAIAVVGFFSYNYVATKRAANPDSPAFIHKPVTQNATLSMGEVDLYIPFGEAGEIRFGQNVLDVRNIVASALPDGTVVMDWNSNTELFNGRESMTVLPDRNSKDNWNWYYSEDSVTETWNFLSVHGTNTGDGVRLNVVLNTSPEMYRVTQYTFPAYFKGEISIQQARGNFRQGLIQSEILPEYEPHRQLLLEETEYWIN